MPHRLKQAFFLMTVYSIIPLLLFSSPTPADQSPGQHGLVDISYPMDWTSDFSLILLDCKNDHEAFRAKEYVEQQGGYIAILIPPEGMLGWIPPEISPGLIGREGVTAVHNQPVSYAAVSRTNENVQGLVDYFNYVTTGQMEQEYYTLRLKGDPLVNDALFNKDWHLRQSKIRTSQKRNPVQPTLLKPEEKYVFGSGNSDYMQGTVACSIFFVESDGSIDQNKYSWSQAAVTYTKNQCMTGLTWWADKAKNRGITLSFTLYYYNPGHKASKQGYEPILHSSSEDGKWIKAVMTDLNYKTGSKFDRVGAFNTSQKNKANADWAYSAFFVYNPPDKGAPARFTDNYFAYAYLGGPFTQLCYKNDGWSTNDIWRVLAHETGHIFWACDEYYQAGYGGCTSCAPCNTFRPEPNNNCEHPSCNPNNSVDCIMKNNANSVCYYTAGQVGWRITNKNLKITASGGGTTNPPPGNYQHPAGTELTIEAIPDSYYRFRQWSGSASGRANPLTVIMDSNKNIRANFQKIYRPANFTGTQVINRSLSQAEYINVLTWEDNPANSSLTIQRYVLYQEVDGTRTVLGEFTSGPYQYFHRNVNPDVAITYLVQAVNDEGIPGEPAILTIQ